MIRKEERVRAICMVDLIQQIQLDRTCVVDWMLKLIMEGADSELEPDIGLRNLCKLLRQRGYDAFIEDQALIEVLRQLSFPQSDENDEVAVAAFRPFIDAFCESLHELSEETQILCPLESDDDGN